MKSSIILGLVSIAFFYYSCVPPVVFTEPQPQGYQPQSTFPIYFRGTFLCDSDSSIVYVNDKTIYKKRNYSMALTIAQIDSIEEATLIGDELFIESVNEPFPVNIINDSVFADIVLSDTLFQISKEQVLTQFRGHQILNTKLNDREWEVSILSLDYDFDLVLSGATYPEDLERLKEITPVTELSIRDTMQYKLSPSVYEFSQILDEHLIFEPCDFYKRIALPIQI